MNASAVLPTGRPVARPERVKDLALLASAGLIAAAALSYEILLTRIFAIVHWQHLVAIAISLALLGYGASGTFLVLSKKLLQRRLANTYVGNALLFGLSALACVVIAQRLTFDPQGLSWDLVQIIPLSTSFLLLAVPFFAAANCIGLALIHAKRDIPLIYGTDLVGAGVGVVVVLIGLSYITVEALLIGLVFVGVLAAMLGAVALGGRLVTVTTVGLTLSLGLVFLVPSDVRPAAYKDAYRALATLGGQVVGETHGVAGVVTVVRNRKIPTRTAPGLSLQSTALPQTQGLKVSPAIDAATASRAAAAAFERDPDLQVDAMRDKVLIATPTTLVFSDRSPEQARLCSAGPSLRWVRSPEAPMITTMAGLRSSTACLLQ